MGSIVLFAAIVNNIQIVITLVLFIWLYSWAKAQLGSPKLAILFSLIATYLTFWSHPILVWILVGLFLLTTFGKEVIQKADVYSD